MEKLFGEHMEKKGGGRFRRKQQLTTLSLGLELFKKTAMKVEDIDVKRGKIEEVIHTIFQALPPLVTSIKVGDELIMRKGNVIEKVPEEKQRQWTLPDIDQYAAARARSAGIRWERKFPSQSS